MPFENSAIASQRRFGSGYCRGHLAGADVALQQLVRARAVPFVHDDVHPEEVELVVAQLQRGAPVLFIVRRRSGKPTRSSTSLAAKPSVHE